MHSKQFIFSIISDGRLEPDLLELAWRTGLEDEWPSLAA